MLKNQIMNSARALLVILCAGTLMTGFAACGNTSSGTSGKSDKIVLLVSTLNNPFFVDVRDGAQVEAKKNKGLIYRYRMPE